LSEAEAARTAEVPPVISSEAEGGVEKSSAPVD